MNKNIFCGLEELGFNNLNNVKLYSSKNKDTNKKGCDKHLSSPKSLLYNKEVICPVCETKFYARAVKTSGYRLEKKDTDFFMLYSTINPYFYDVWVCNSCGYAALKVDFLKIREYQKEFILNKITSKWNGREYPDEYNIDIAIQRYKLALLNYTVIQGKSSQKAMTCLKLAWMYRILKDTKNELIFLKQSLVGFNDSYSKESFPIYGMDKFTMMYLIGELYRRTGDNEKGLLWFGQVITNPIASQKLKNLARDQKELIKENQVLEQSNLDDSSSKDTVNLCSSTKKKSFFSKLFKLK